MSQRPRLPIFQQQAMDVQAEEEFNYSDFEDENDFDEETAEAEEHTRLIQLLFNFEWPAVLHRIQSHPHETKLIGPEGRTPLHIACDSDAPAVVISALLKTYPEATIMTGTSNMNPLHITCSSLHASVHVLRVLLENGRFEQFSMRDLDGDTPLHAACRCGAPMEVIQTLLRSYPAAVRVRDYEGLTPLLRLWVRYFVILGDDVINSVQSFADLRGELLDAWRKTELLLQCSYLNNLNHPSHFFSMLHAAAAVDCPRPIVKIAARVLPHLLDVRDDDGRTPLMVACETPIYKVRDLSDEGFSLEHVVYEENNQVQPIEKEDAELLVSGQPHPTVIQILLENHHNEASHGAAVTDPSGRLPLHIALNSGKRWHQGIRDLVEYYPESVKVADQSSKLFPYQLAATKADLSTCYELLRCHPDLVKGIRQRRAKQLVG